MTRNKKGAAPNLQTFAEKLQNLEDNRATRRVYKAVREITEGSDSTAHVWARYYTAAQVEFADGQDWIYGQPNPDAGRTNRSKKRAIVLGVGSMAVDSLKGELRDKESELMPAVAYRYKGVAHAGILPDGFGMLYTPSHATIDFMHVAAMRSGNEPIEAQLGLFNMATQTLWIPESVHIVDDLVPTTELAPKYPGVPLA